MDEEYRNRQKRYFDKRHAARSLPRLSAGNRVWLKDKGAPGTILRPSQTPRSYWVGTDKGAVRRNRRHLLLLPETGDDDSVPSAVQRDHHQEEIDVTPKPQVPELPAKLPATTPVKYAGHASETTGHRRTTRCGRIIKTPKRLGVND
ncbi:hypothetical protein V5799_024166 [Amblyomma americanum]|uniref:Uncharacterized protein n=1 Tax=Amblyomma americanum TaxID=6943 RepID=A0AAQ4ECT6_AMBAM